MLVDVRPKYINFDKDGKEIPPALRGSPDLLGRPAETGTPLVFPLTQILRLPFLMLPPSNLSSSNLSSSNKRCRSAP